MSARGRVNLTSILCLVTLVLVAIPTGVVSATSNDEQLTVVEPGRSWQREMESRQYSCLPKDIKKDDIVGFAPDNVQKITVTDKLQALRARCRREKLVDRHRREIRFYKLTGCWGNPPQGYQAILARQQKEIAALGKRYTVVEMTCNTTGRQVQ